LPSLQCGMILFPGYLLAGAFTDVVLAEQDGVVPECVVQRKGGNANKYGGDHPGAHFIAQRSDQCHILFSTGVKRPCPPRLPVCAKNRKFNPYCLLVKHPGEIKFIFLRLVECWKPAT